MYRRFHILAWVLTLLFLLPTPQQSSAQESLLKGIPVPPGLTGLYVLEKGEEALLARAWLTQQATRSITVQYFIWSSDNVGILAAEQLLTAAERGVKVRVIVDDLLIDAPDRSLLALAQHPNVEIRIYRPLHKVGVSFWERIANLATDFRGANQRMHDKTFVVDNKAAIVGGRNMADEYFDYDHEYNYRDRDLLLLGPTAEEITISFERFWNSPYAEEVSRLVKMPLSETERHEVYRELHAYAQNPANFAPIVRQTLAQISSDLPLLMQNLHFGLPQVFVDDPGKNPGEQGLQGSSASTEALVEIVKQAQHSVVIQTPYLVLTDRALELFRELVKRGVQVRIVTNSLAATDNLIAFGGYQNQREEMIAAGIQVREFRPDATSHQKLRDGFASREVGKTRFAIHAKTMVVDGKRLVIGTFNLDPRSAHLNTEIVLSINHPTLAGKIEKAILRDMEPGNSWDPQIEDTDNHASWGKRVKSWFFGCLPLKPLL